MDTQLSSRTLACLACRSKKRRCNGARPICSLCEDLDRHCEYDTRPQSQLRDLKDKIKFLEAAIQEIQSIPPNQRHHHRRQKHREKDPMVDPTSPCSSEDDDTPIKESALAVVEISPSALALFEDAMTIDPDRYEWWRTGELPTNVRDHLVSVFLEHRQSCDLELHIPNLMARLSLPTTSPHHPHPCFVNAMCLIGAHFDRKGPYHRFEKLFLSRTRKCMEESLAMADRLVCFVKASLLLTCWYFLKGRSSPEGVAQASTTVRFAMGCGLHKLTSPARWNNTHSTIVDPPQDVIAFEDRVNLFWAVTNVDATGSSIARVPSSLAPDEEIETCWPLSWQAYGTRNPSANPRPQYSLSDLFTPGSPACDVRHDDITALASKSRTLMSRAFRIFCDSHRDHSVDLTQTAEFHAFDHVTVQFTESIPPLRLHSDKLDLQLMMVHTVACASVVVVLGLAANDGEAMRKAKEAALRVVSMAKASLAYRGVGFLPPVVGFGWLSALSFLQKIQSPDPANANVNQEISILMSALSKLAHTYPTFKTLLSNSNTWKKPCPRT